MFSNFRNTFFLLRRVVAFAAGSHATEQALALAALSKGIIQGLLAVAQQRIGSKGVAGMAAVTEDLALV